MKTCAKCGSTTLIRSAMLLDHTRHSAIEARVEVQADPDAFLMKESVQGTLRPVICGSCGYVELYVSNPGELLAAEQTALRRRDR